MEAGADHRVEAFRAHLHLDVGPVAVLAHLVRVRARVRARARARVRARVGARVRVRRALGPA